MQYRVKKKKKTPYACLIKAINRLIVSTTKVYIANELDINVRTITRNMENTNIYETNEYIIWRNIPIHIGKGRNYGGGSKSEY